MSKKNFTVLTLDQTRAALNMVRAALCEHLLSPSPEKIVLTAHARRRMKERLARPFDVVTVLLNGRIGTSPIRGKHPFEFRFRVDGYDVAGISLAVVVALDMQLRRRTIVTVYGYYSDAGDTSGVAALIILWAARELWVFRS